MGFFDAVGHQCANHTKLFPFLGLCLFAALAGSGIANSSFKFSTTDLWVKVRRAAPKAACPQAANSHPSSRARARAHPRVLLPLLVAFLRGSAR